MTSRPRAIVQMPADPKQIKAMEEAAAHMRKESEKLSKLQDIKAIEEKRRAVEKDLDQAQDMASDILRRANEEAEALRHAAQLECQAQHDQARLAIGEAKAAVEKLRQALVAEQELLSVEKEDFRQEQLSHGEALRHLAREEELLHGRIQEFKGNQIRHQASVEAHRADLSSLALRERKIHEMETRTIEGLKTVQERELAIAGKEDTAHRLKEDATRELTEANARSHEAQEKWNRADRREQECDRREKALAAREREFSTQEQSLGLKLQAIDAREKKCLLREAQRQAAS